VTLDGISATDDCAEASELETAKRAASLRECVTGAVRRYLADLDDCAPDDLYEVVLREVESPLLAEVMRHYGGNQSRTAAALGINRATLRKKLRLYGLG
jgi:Fis family transcriptional regulator, factor for inversion stimulation protein